MFRSSSPSPFAGRIESEIRRAEAAGVCTVVRLDPEQCDLILHVTTVGGTPRMGVPALISEVPAALFIRDFPQKSPRLRFTDRVPFHPFVKGGWPWRGEWNDRGLIQWNNGFDRGLREVARLLSFEGLESLDEHVPCANITALRWYHGWIALARVIRSADPAPAPANTAGRFRVTSAVRPPKPTHSAYTARSGRLQVIVSRETVSALTSVGAPVVRGPIELVVRVKKHGRLHCRAVRRSVQPYNPHFTKSRLWGLLPARWVDPSPSADGPTVDQVLERIARALSFDPTVIKLAGADVANPAAAAWWGFMSEAVRTIELPLSRSSRSREAPKKFAIMEHPSEKPSKPVTLRQNVKFDVQSVDDGYKPSLLSPTFLTSPVKSESIVQGPPSAKAALHVTDAAMRRIHDHIEWKRSSSQNLVEQGGILLGSTIQDPVTGLLHGFVTDAIAAKSGARGSGAHLEMGHEAWHGMLVEADAIRDASNGATQLIGWYHTHPGQLDVFMSSVDRHTQETFFAEDWQFAIVLNPQRELWRVFHGRAAVECRGYWLMPTA